MNSTDWIRDIVLKEWRDRGDSETLEELETSPSVLHLRLDFGNEYKKKKVMKKKELSSWRGEDVGRCPIFSHVRPGFRNRPGSSVRRSSHVRWGLSNRSD